MPESEYIRLKGLWNNLLCASECLFAFCSCVAAYFDDMERMAVGHPRLSAAVKDAENVFLKYDDTGAVMENKGGFVNGMERNSFLLKNDIVEVYPRPLRGMLQLLQEEYDAEFAARMEHRDWGDLFIPGSITDEWRCERAMHGCHATLQNGCLCRIIGNQVFPNGTLGFELANEAVHDTILLSGEGNSKISVNGKESEIKLSAETSIKVEPGTKFHILLQGTNGTYPVLYAAGLSNEPW